MYILQCLNQMKSAVKYIRFESNMDREERWEFRFIFLERVYQFLSYLQISSSVNIYGQNECALSILDS